MTKQFFWKIWLKLNPFAFAGSTQNDYMAEVSTQHYTLRNEDLARLIVEARTEHHYETILALLNERDRMVRTSLLKGFTVQDSNFHHLPRVTGLWTGAEAKFDAARHKLTVDTTLTASLRATLGKQVGVEVLGEKVAGGALIGLVTDVASGRTDGRLTAGGEIIIEGEKLKLAPPEPPSGVFFVNSREEAIPVKDRLIANGPRKIICRIPSEVTAGNYRLQITTRFSSTNGKLLKTHRTIEYSQSLVVES
ncbi:MAG: DUF4469 domain-containing protein [Tannerellaceae bacterium]|jgi:hypothetical protein|nr:DUF4469 domain-containing protein [Tannerellaceae bacterium]